ncbi:MAG: DUF1427 family protein [Candidatus Caenarcaniphilales bacterium]|nr:DUF1427 family protein [Candidatus Caenarcaniphilales bacterium]
MKDSQIKSLLGLLIGFSIGIVCKFASLPLPAPPMILGSVLVLSITLGYMLIDNYLNKQKSEKVESK